MKQLLKQWLERPLHFIHAEVTGRLWLWAADMVVVNDQTQADKQPPSQMRDEYHKAAKSMPGGTWVAINAMGRLEPVEAGNAEAIGVTCEKVVEGGEVTCVPLDDRSRDDMLIKRVRIFNALRAKDADKLRTWKLPDGNTASELRHLSKLIDELMTRMAWKQVRIKPKRRTAGRKKSKGR